MKLALKIGWTAICLLALVPVLCSEPISQLKATDYVNDFAHVLDSETIRQLDDVCLQIDQKAHAQIAVVTVNSLDGSDIESYTSDLFKKWGVGAKSTDKGVLILLAVNDRRYRVEVGYGLEPILPDGKVGGFGREAVPFLKQGNYNAAVLLLTSRVANVIAQDAGVTLTNVSVPAPLPAPRERPGISLGWIIFFVVILILALATRVGREILFWVLLSGLGGGGRGSDSGWGGGGFGGGGGGFGGFGGGSSGGGGASGSW